MTREEYKIIQNGGVVWLKNNPRDKISWKHSNDDNIVFRFDDDPEKEFFLYRDYSKLTPERKKVFDKENPFWARYFSGN